MNDDSFSGMFYRVAWLIFKNVSDKFASLFVRVRGMFYPEDGGCSFLRNVGARLHGVTLQKTVSFM
jgi:hypothetical protein